MPNYSRMQNNLRNVKVFENAELLKKDRFLIRTTLKYITKCRQSDISPKEGSEKIYSISRKIIRDLDD